MNRKLKPVTVAVLAAAGLFTAAAHAEGLYAGASLGVPHFGDGVNGVGGSGSGISGKIYGGWQLTPNFAVEGGLADLGRINNANGTVNSHGEYLDAVGLLPVGANFSLLGSVGLAHVDINTSNGDDRGVGLKLGLGGEYALSRNVSLRGEYEHYQAAAFDGHPALGQYTFGVRIGF